VTVPVATVDGGDVGTGCWVDGHWGQYASDRVISIARFDFGWAPDDHLQELVVQYALSRLNCIGTAGVEADAAQRAAMDYHNAQYEGARKYPADLNTVDEWRIELSDKALEHMNSCIVHDDQGPTAWFDWMDGELFLFTADEWRDTW